MMKPGPKPGFKGTEEQRFWSKVRVNEQTGCWEWTAGRTNKGYGGFYLDGRIFVLAHVYAYNYCIGPIPEGLEPDHLCRVRHCVNPAHLEPVTRKINLLRGNTLAAANARKTHCPHGHEYNRENTINHKYGRQCRTCKNKYTSEYAKRRRQSSNAATGNAAG